ncbi:MAG: biopolymer transporter ExbD [Pedobacter sp.]|nr:biopolymer transporter ExbD [Pedobacter sp.]
MAFGGFNQQGSNAPMAEINMIPLIDVMLVLLVIFMVTAPLMSHAVKVNLPTASSAPVKPSEKIDLSLDGSGQLYWDKQPLSKEEVLARLNETGLKAPDTEVHLHADKDTRYELIAEIMSGAAQAGLSKIGFVTQPGKDAAAAH